MELLLYSPFIILGASVIICGIGGCLANKEMEKIKKQGVGVD